MALEIEIVQKSEPKTSRQSSLKEEEDSKDSLSENEQLAEIRASISSKLGSRKLQKKLESNDPDFIALAFESICEDIFDLLVD